MEKRLSTLLSIVPPKPDYDRVRRAIEDADTKPEVAAVLKQFASMPPSTGILANPVRHQRTMRAITPPLDLSIRSFTVQGMLMEEHRRGCGGPPEVIFVGLFGRFATADQITLFSLPCASVCISSGKPDATTCALHQMFPDTSPDIACSIVRRYTRCAQARSAGRGHRTNCWRR
jgi:hypothetical protein